MGLTNEIGIMQGRLSPRIDGKIQAYPASTWQNEFEIAQEIGYAAIEWIVEKPLQTNALMTDSGKAEIKKVIASTGVRIDYVCADIFMQQPLVRMTEEIKSQNKDYLLKILKNAKEVGAVGVEIPFVDNSSIKNDNEKQELIGAMQDAFKLAKDLNIKISLETDLSPIAFKELLEQIDLDFVQANYDIGNSASLGFDPKEELNAYGQRILNVHVKDRKLGGTTVTLGTGNANLDLVFKELNEISYSGGITIQAARGDDDVKIAKEQFGYVQSIIENIR
jgi:L-ribulose-5-phosphate 3-epimerase